MLLLLSLLSLFSLLPCLPYTFQSYLIQFNKSYPTEEQYQHRKQLFTQNYTSIEQFNNRTDQLYKLGPSIMTDWTQAEINDYLRADQDPNEQITAFPRLPLKVRSARSATGVNWNMSGKVTPVKYQGQCGDCWAFAATAILESYILIRRKVNYTEYPIDLSEQYVLECSIGDNDCSGGLIQDALKSIVSPRGLGGGLPSQSLYPYTAYNYLTSKPSTPGICLTATSQRTTFSNLTTYFKYFNLTIGNVRALLNFFPVATMIYADRNFVSYRSGTYQCEFEVITPEDLNHAIVIVGWTSSGQWIIKNSWSKMWGVGGFGYVNMTRDCGMRLFVYAFNETTRVGKYGWRVMLGMAVAVVTVLAV